jgi:mRNA interferase MazF
MWTVAGVKDCAGKPRPVVIVQDDSFDATASARSAGSPRMRPARHCSVCRVPNEGNGLRLTCCLMVDEITTVSRTKVGVRVGRLVKAGELPPDLRGDLPDLRDDLNDVPVLVSVRRLTEHGFTDTFEKGVMDAEKATETELPARERRDRGTGRSGQRWILGILGASSHRFEILSLTIKARCSMGLN